MQRKLSARLALLVVIGAPLGCSLLTDVSGLAGVTGAGRDAAETNRVPSEMPDSSSRVEAALEAGSDTSLDAGPDGAPDGRPDVGPPFCSSLAPVATLCEDFDVLPFGAGWSSVVEPGGVVALDTARFVSGPSSRRFHVPPGTPGTCRSVQDLRTLSAGYLTRVRVEYDLYLGHADDTAGFPLNSYVNRFKISGASGTKPCTVALNPREGETVLYIAGAAANGQVLPLSIGVDPRRWTRVAVEIVNDPASTPVANVWIDGKIALDASPINLDLCDYGLLKSVDVGLFCMSGAVDGEARVDNFVARGD